MTRTQIYLGDEELAYLNRAADATGASRSELIRRAIRSTFGDGTKAEGLKALRRSAGTWQDQPSTGEEYVDRMRGDLSERLARLGLE